jgi:ribonucleoside-diphosphate reductase alpha chain
MSKTETLQKQVADSAQKLEQQATELAALRAENVALRAKIGIPVRTRLPDTRRAVTHKFRIGDHEGYMTVGMYDSGAPGELFVTMSKEGSTIGGLMDTVGCLTSIALQYGVDIATLADKFSHQRFEPSGWTGNPQIRSASSIIDYVFRWMAITFARPEPVKEPAAKSVEAPEPAPAAPAPQAATDCPPCARCGTIMERSGRCHRCPNCGDTSGCS